MKVAAALLALGAMIGTAGAQETLSVYAAGSLRAPLTELGSAFKSKTGVEIRYTFGASGLLKERIEKGEAADVFASANTEHPQALAAAGLAGPVRIFTRNEMCLLAAPQMKIVDSHVLSLMLDPAVKLGTSTPKADPSGDYAWMIFDKAEKVLPGSYARLDAKALKLTGGPGSPTPPENRNVYGELLAKGQADVFLTYCTNAVLAIAEHPTQHRVALPASLAVGADYGMTVLKNGKPSAESFANFLLAAEAQAVFARYGFGAIGAQR